MKKIEKKLTDMAFKLSDMFFEEDNDIFEEPTQEELDFNEQYDEKYDVIHKEVSALIHMMSNGLYFANLDKDFFLYPTTFKDENYTFNFVRNVRMGYTEEGILVKNSKGDEVLFNSDGKSYGYFGELPIEVPELFDCFFEKWSKYRDFAYEKVKEYVETLEKSKKEN